MPIATALYRRKGRRCSSWRVWAHAKARGAEIYAEVTGWGVSSDAFHLVQPHDEGKGAALAIKLALQDAERNVEDIDYINAHGTSTPLNDKSETLAIKRAFGDHAYNIPVSSTKSMTGTHWVRLARWKHWRACSASATKYCIQPSIWTHRIPTAIWTIFRTLPGTRRLK